MYTRAAFGVRVLVSGGLLVYLFRSLDWREARMLLANVEPAHLALPPLAAFAGLAILAFRWHTLLRELGIALTWARSLIFLWISSFYSLVLPGIVGGDPVRVGLAVSSTGGSIGNITLSVALERVVGLVSVILVGAAATLLIPRPYVAGLGVDVLHAMRLAALVAVLASIAVIALGRWSPAVDGRTSSRTWRVIAGIQSRFQGPKRLRMLLLLWLLVLSAVAQGCDILSAWLIARALGLDYEASLFFVLLPIVFVATALPISLGGLGVREGVLVFLLSRVGAAPSDGTLLAFAIYANRLAVSLVGSMLPFSASTRARHGAGNDLGPT